MPDANTYIKTIVTGVTAQNPGAAELQHRLHDETGTSLQHWADHLSLPADAGHEDALLQHGWAPVEPDQTEDGRAVYRHDAPGTPPVLVGGRRTQLAIRTDSVSDFLTLHRLPRARVEGRPLSQLRTVTAFIDGDTELLAVERHATRAFGSQAIDANFAMRSMAHYERLRCRGRDHDDPAAGFAELRRLLESAVSELGEDLTCDLFFRTEREHYTRRNAAARAQKARQDALGLGWSNHHQHVYRSSADQAALLTETLGSVGLHPSKDDPTMLIQRTAGITVVVESDQDAERWCADHGQSILAAGLYRLVIRADTDRLAALLAVADQPNDPATVGQLAAADE